MRLIGLESAGNGFQLGLESVALGHCLRGSVLQFLIVLVLLSGGGGESGDFVGLGLQLRVEAGEDETDLVNDGGHNSDNG